MAAPALQFWLRLPRAILNPMQMDYPGPNGLRRRPQIWLQLTLLIGFLFCLVLGVGALAAVVLLQTEPATDAGLPPVAAFPRTQIVPHHALMQLAGDPPLAIAYQALQAGELDTAYAVALFTPELTDAQRLALLLQLGRRYLDAGQPETAVTAFDLAQSVTVLGIALTPIERSQALLQIATGYLDAEKPEAARAAAVQTRRLGVQTPGLLPAQRAQIFESLRPVAKRLEDTSLSQEIDDLANNPYLTPGGVLRASRWITLTEAVAPDPAVDAATTTRLQAARALADRIAFTGGIDVDPERQTLTAALVAEDQARGAAFQRAVGAGLTLNQQIGLLHERRAWLALKARIALGGFGMALAPEWEAAPQAILQELAATTNNLITVVENLITTLPEPAAQAMLRSEALTWLAGQSALGLLPGVSPLELSDRLRTAQNELTRLGAPLALPITYDRSAQPPGFRIVPPELLQ
jgi:hypothetical protein